MIEYKRELTALWGESDPFGLVYFPRMLSWFNDTEHELLRRIGHSTESMIERDARPSLWARSIFASSVPRPMATAF